MLVEYIKRGYKIHKASWAGRSGNVFLHNSLERDQILRFATQGRGTNKRLGREVKVHGQEAFRGQCVRGEALRGVCCAHAPVAELPVLLLTIFAAVEGVLAACALLGRGLLAEGAYSG